MQIGAIENAYVSQFGESAQDEVPPGASSRRPRRSVARRVGSNTAGRWPGAGSQGGLQQVPRPRLLQPTHQGAPHDPPIPTQRLQRPPAALGLMWRRSQGRARGRAGLRHRQLCPPQLSLPGVPRPPCAPAAAHMPAQAARSHVGPRACLHKLQRGARGRVEACVWRGRSCDTRRWGTSSRSSTRRHWQRTF